MDVADCQDHGKLLSNFLTKSPLESMLESIAIPVLQMRWEACTLYRGVRFSVVRLTEVGTTLQTVYVRGSLTTESTILKPII